VDLFLIAEDERMLSDSYFNCFLAFLPYDRNKFKILLQNLKIEVPMNHSVIYLLEKKMYLVPLGSSTCSVSEYNDDTDTVALTS
jgi:hypothetical protein